MFVERANYRTQSLNNCLGLRSGVRTNCYYKERVESFYLRYHLPWRLSVHPVGFDNSDSDPEME